MWNEWSHEFDRSFAILDEMRREMDRLFDGLDRQFGGALPRPGGSLGTSPRLDGYDEGESYLVVAPLPGFTEKDIRAHLGAVPGSGVSSGAMSRA